MIIMSDKLVAADEDENTRHTFMVFDTNCKFEMNRILSYIIFFFIFMLPLKNIKFFKIEILYKVIKVIVYEKTKNNNKDS